MLFFKTDMSFFLAWFVIIMLKISDEIVKFLLNHNYLFWSPLFIGTQCGSTHMRPGSAMR